MKCFNLHPGEILVIGDATIALIERRRGAGHHARLLVDGPANLRFELRKPSGVVLPRHPAPNATSMEAQDVPHPRAFTRA